MVRNKIAAILAAAAILSVSAVSADAPYTDLGSLTDRAAVDYLYDTQCLTFITGDTFEPNRVLTRGDLAQLLYNSAANIPLAPVEAAGASDVPSGTAGDAMNSVAAQGILAGYQDGNFHPEEPVSREEFADVIYRYLQYRPSSPMPMPRRLRRLTPGPSTSCTARTSWCRQITISIPKKA